MTFINGHSSNGRPPLWPHGNYLMAHSVDAAVRSATNAASALAMIISLCVNAVVEAPALRVAFNSTAGAPQVHLRGRQADLRRRQPTPRPSSNR